MSNPESRPSSVIPGLLLVEHAESQSRPSIVIPGLLLRFEAS